VMILGSHDKDIDFAVMGPAILHEVLWCVGEYFSSLVVRESLAVHCCVFCAWRGKY
jgi:hypothetical protein